MAEIGQSPTEEPLLANPLLSIIIPAYNEAKRLGSTLRLLHNFLADQPYSAEVLVVDDGSEDDTAAQVAFWRERGWGAASLAQGPGPSSLRLLRSMHTGKGQAIRLGVSAARGEYVFFCDADLSMPISELPRFLPPALTDYDMAIGSREGPGARRYHEPLYRHILGRLFNYFIRLAVGLPFADTQCGFKCLRRAVAQELSTQQTITGWAFDVELLVIGQRRGYRIVVVPIQWYFRASSRLRPFRDALRMAQEVWTIRGNDRNHHYDAPLADGTTALISQKQTAEH